MENVILSTDSYKLTHWKQYPPGTTKVKSYLESRGGAFAKILTFGALQYFVAEMLMRHIEPWMLEEAQEVIQGHIGPGIFNLDGWTHILREWDGYLPLKVRAVKEGLFVPPGIALFTIENTDPAVPWLTNYLETAFYPWYPYTVATLSHRCRQIIQGYLERTGDPTGVDFKLHDFGYRGVSSEESAGIGGMAHLVSFKGSDTLPAVLYARKYYEAPMAAQSIPAAEHSTITSWGRGHEVDAFRNMLEVFPTGLVAVVSDSYNIYAACEHLWGEVLHDEVMKRQGTLVIRPDSGDPPTVVLKCLDILGHKFGTTRNQKGFKLLPPQVRLIQGDGVDPVMIDKVLAVMELNGWSADNTAFGMGGALLQKVNRDTCQFAMKCCMIERDGKQIPVSKDPVTDKGKRSKAGDLTTGFDGKDYFTLEHGAFPEEQDVMETIYENGRVLRHETLHTIRGRAGTV